MTIDDIIRYFSGGRPSGTTEESGYDIMGNQTGMGPGILSQPVVAPQVAPAPRTAPQAGAGRGVVNPPRVDPAGPAPLSPLPPPIEVPARPPIASVMAGQDQPEEFRGNGAQMGPPTQAQPIPGLKGFEQGFMGKAGDYLNNAFGFSDPDFLGRLGNALAVAGSQDPQKALMMLRNAQTEDEKVRQARLKAKQGETKYLGNGLFAEYSADGKLSRTYVDPTTAAIEAKARDEKLTDKVDGMIAQGRITQATQQAQLENKTAADARPMLNDIQGLKGRWGQAMEVVSGQGVGAQIQGIPGIAGIAGFFGGDEVAKNKFLQGLTVDETLLNTAKTKGAISNQEMNLFKSPIPSITDDREKVWKPWIEKRLEVLDKMEKFYASEVGRDAAPGANLPQSSRSGATASPPPSDQLRAAVTAAGIPFEPEKFQYRIGPNGQVQRKAK